MPVIATYWFGEFEVIVEERDVDLKFILCQPLGRGIPSKEIHGLECLLL